VKSNQKAVYFERSTFWTYGRAKFGITWKIKKRVCEIWKSFFTAITVKIVVTFRHQVISMSCLFTSQIRPFYATHWQ
jgi:hypothetical protein